MLVGETRVPEKDDEGSLALIVSIFNWRGRTGEQRDQRKRRGRKLRPMRLISWIESSLGFIVRRS